MTFKHIKFDDSPVMRSLERIAKEKGMVKESLLEKIASRSAMVKKADLTPTTNLMENLIKLCSGLREEGFDKYADELESTFMMFKQAQTLYETSKETGEDLVDMAHPKGSHTLEGVSGDAVFETIIDQQLKDIKMVEKKPTGKLSNAREIISAVKICLADEINIPFDFLMLHRKQAAFDMLRYSLMYQLDEANKKIMPFFKDLESSELISFDVTARNTFQNQYTKIKENVDKFEKTQGFNNLASIIDDISTYLDRASTNIVPIYISDLLGSNLTAQKKSINMYINNAKGVTQHSKRILNGEDENIENKIKEIYSNQQKAPQTEEEKKKKEQNVSKIQEHLSLMSRLLSDITLFRSKIEQLKEPYKTNGQKYLDNMKAEILIQKNKLLQLKSDDLSYEVDLITIKDDIVELKRSFDSFKTTWSQ